MEPYVSTIFNKNQLQVQLCSFCHFPHLSEEGPPFSKIEWAKQVVKSHGGWQNIKYQYLNWQGELSGLIF